MKENKQRAKEEAMQNELTYGSTPAKTPKRRIAGTTILTPANKRVKVSTSFNEYNFKLFSKVVIFEAGFDCWATAHRISLAISEIYELIFNDDLLKM